MSQYGSDCGDHTSDSRLPSQAESENSRGHAIDAESVGESREDTVGKHSASRGGHEPHLVHKSIRMRLRPSGKSSNNVTSNSQSPSLQSWKSPFQLQGHSSTLSVQPIEVDPEAEMYIDLGSSQRAAIPRTGSDASLTLSDFSNYLSSPSKTCSQEAMNDVATTLNNDSDCRFASSGDDLYGWDAELERRNNTTPCPMESCSHDCNTISLSYRRANGARHNLLQRVFKVGSSTSLPKFESSR